MTMSRYVNGPRTALPYLPGAAVNAGDVVVIGNLTAISDVDDPVGTGLSIVQTNLYVGGVYQVAADAAYAVGTQVYWNATAQQVTTTATGNKSFGVIVAGPTGLASDGGSTGAGGLCNVLHQPI